MVEYAANRLLNKMVQKGLLIAEKKDIYFYAMITLAEKAITGSVILILSLIWHISVPTVIFLILLFGIRKHTGGFHADKFSYCFISTTSIYIVFATIIYPILLNHMQVVYGMMVLSGITLELLGAVNHPNMDWNRTEYEESKKLARMTVAFEIAVIVILSVLGMSDEYTIFMSFAVNLSAFLLVSAKIFHQEVKNDTEKKY